MIDCMVSPFVLRKEIVEYGQRIYEKNFVAGTDGNISCRLSDGEFLITPSGMAKGRMNPDDLVVIDADGNLTGGKNKPSSEFKLHTFIYSKRSDVDTIIHAHPVFCTAFACTENGFAQNILPEIVVTAGGIPLAEYGTPSTAELPESIAGLITEHDTILLQNHGIVTVGRNLEEAYIKLETAEHFAKILHAAQDLGGAKPLSRAAVDKLMEIKEQLNPNASDPGFIPSRREKEE